MAWPFLLAQLAAAYLPSLAVWLATAFSFVFAGLTALQKRKLTSVVLLTVAACLGFAAHLVYEPLAVQPVLELAGRQVRVVATAGTDSETSYQEDRLRGTLHITELDGEPADLLVTCASFPGSRPGEIFSATLELQNLDEDSYADELLLRRASFYRRNMWESMPILARAPRWNLFYTGFDRNCPAG